MIKDNEQGHLVDAAREFLISEFQCPHEEEEYGENAYAVFDYRMGLVRHAYYIIGGQEDGAHNKPFVPPSGKETVEKDES